MATELIHALFNGKNCLTQCPHYEIMPIPDFSWCAQFNDYIDRNINDRCDTCLCVFGKRNKERNSGHIETEPSEWFKLLHRIINDCADETIHSFGTGDHFNRALALWMKLLTAYAVLELHAALCDIVDKDKITGETSLPGNTPGERINDRNKVSMV